MSQTRRKSSRLPQAPDPDMDLLDLDALVLAEIESLTTRRDAVRSRQAPCAAPVPPAEAAERKAKASVAQLRRAPERGPDGFGEGAELLFEGLEPPESPVEVEPDGQETGLLCPEEEAFITRAVGFLSRRPAADIILNRIWEQLTELDPEGYYQAPLDLPAEAKRGETPPASAEDEGMSAAPREDPAEC